MTDIEPILVYQTKEVEIMATVYRVKNPKRRLPWMLQVTFKINGESTRYSKCFATEAEAYAHLEEIEKRHIVPILPKAPPTFKITQPLQATPPIAVAPPIYAPAEIPQKPKKTVTWNGKIYSEDSYFYDFANYVVEAVCDCSKAGRYNHNLYLSKCRNAGFLCNIALKDLAFSHFKEALDWHRRNGGRDGVHASISAMNAVYIILNKVADEAFKSGLINYKIDLSPIKPKSPAKKRDSQKYIKPQVRDKVLSALEQSGNRALYIYMLLMFNTSMRPQEGAALAWSSVLFDSNEIYICEAFKTDGRIGCLKTEREGEEFTDDRYNEVPQEVMAILKEYQNEQIRTQGKCERIFTRPNGTVMSRNTFTKEFSAFINSLIEQDVIKKNEYFTVKNTRSTYGTDLVELGLPPSMITEIMGHSYETFKKNYDQTDSRKANAELRKRLEERRKREG